VGEPVAGAGILYFTADDGRHGPELWRSDGTSAGTALVKDIRPGLGGLGPTYPMLIGDVLYFSVQTPTCRGELWRTDGTRRGTVRLMATTPDRGLVEFYGTC
jgi:ELWxxDGT repeat protein